MRRIYLMYLVRLLMQCTVLAFYLTMGGESAAVLAAVVLMGAFLTISTLLQWAHWLRPGTDSAYQPWFLSGEILVGFALHCLGLAHGTFGPAMVILTATTMQAVMLYLQDRNRWVLGLNVAALLAANVITLVMYGWQSFGNLALFLVLCLFFGVYGYLWHELDREKEQARQLAAQVKQLAVAEERARLARDMHDSVAHQLTALLVQIQTGRRLLGRVPQEQAEAYLTQAEATAREALAEVRRSVRALKPAAVAAGLETAALQSLAEQFQAATGAQVAVEFGPELTSLPPSPLRAEMFYRIAQECLTNAQRHGGATAMAIRLTRTAAGLELHVTNNGQVPDAVTPGFGLLTMQERAAELGGTAAVELAPGFAVRVQVPFKEGRS